MALAFALTNTDDGQSLVHQHRVLGHVASRPVRTPVPLELGECDGPGAERGEVALAVVAAEDAAHGGSALRRRAGGVGLSRSELGRQLEKDKLVG